ncbi:MAG TPA: DUF2203 domain-containing protein [Candidatus Polarisedimenticolia bacterium]|nr:DUF2203 domain-containing protein [Candidatus Polarisedimenticolia bacterium]
MNGESREPRLFTVQEARRALEEIRPLVGRMLRAFAEIREEIDAATRSVGLRPGHPDLARHLEIRGIAPRLLQDINALIQEIQSHGCVVNGPEGGLIDFPCLMRDEIVFLCWKFGEPQIEYWHRIPDGYAGRRPLLETEERPEGDLPVH